MKEVLVDIVAAAVARAEEVLRENDVDGGGDDDWALFNDLQFPVVAQPQHHLRPPTSNLQTLLDLPDEVSLLIFVVVVVIG